MQSPANRRTAAQLRALRRFAMAAAWEQARHVVSCYTPGAKDLVTEARRLLAWGWKEAKLAEKHGHLPVEVEATPAPQPVASVTWIKAQIENLENTDRLGWAGIQRLGDLRLTLREAERRVA